MSLRVLVCCGSGGVGKTTTSAALAMQAAARLQEAFHTQVQHFWLQIF